MIRKRLLTAAKVLFLSTLAILIGASGRTTPVRSATSKPLPTSLTLEDATLQPRSTSLADEHTAVPLPLPENETQLVATPSPLTDTPFQQSKHGTRIVSGPQKAHGVQYKVRRGDTASTIARRFRIDLDRFLSANLLSHNAIIRAGDTLILPGVSQIARASEETPSVAIAPARNVTALSSLNNDYIVPTSGFNFGKLHAHNGVDIANACGSPVYAAREGLVVTAQEGQNDGYGKLVEVQHFDGSIGVYGHLRRIHVEEGQSVGKGDLVGEVGNSGKTYGATGCHLHFEVRGGKNPLAR